MVTFFWSQLYYFSNEAELAITQILLAWRISVEMNCRTGAFCCVLNCTLFVTFKLWFRNGNVVFYFVVCIFQWKYEAISLIYKADFFASGILKYSVALCVCRSLFIEKCWLMLILQYFLNILKWYYHVINSSEGKILILFTP